VLEIAAFPVGSPEMKMSPQGGIFVSDYPAGSENTLGSLARRLYVCYNIPVKIVEPNLSNLPELVELWGKQYKYHHNLDDEYYVPDSSDLREQFEAYLKKAIVDSKPNILVAYEEDKMVGFITFETAKADYFDTNITKYGEIFEIFVEEACRNKSFGKNLLKAAEEHFANAGIKYVELQVSTFNNNALEVYKHLGYTDRQTLMFKKL